MTKHTSIKTQDVNFFTCTCVERVSLPWISAFINEYSKQFVTMRKHYFIEDILIQGSKSDPGQTTQRFHILHKTARSKWPSCTSAKTLNNYKRRYALCDSVKNLFYRRVPRRVWKIPRNSSRSFRFNFDNTKQDFFALSSTRSTFQAVGSLLFISNV